MLKIFVPSCFGPAPCYSAAFGLLRSPETTAWRILAATSFGEWDVFPKLSVMSSRMFQNVRIVNRTCSCHGRGVVCCTFSLVGEGGVSSTHPAVGLSQHLRVKSPKNASSSLPSPFLLPFSTPSFALSVPNSPSAVVLLGGSVLSPLAHPGVPAVLGDAAVGAHLHPTAGVHW